MSDEILSKILAKLESIEERLAKLEKTAPLPPPRGERPCWMFLPEAAKNLGISCEAIRDRIRDGRWTHGKEYINVSDGLVPRYRIQVVAARKLLEIPPEKRRPGKKAK